MSGFLSRVVCSFLESGTRQAASHEQAVRKTEHSWVVETHFMLAIVIGTSNWNRKQIGICLAESYKTRFSGCLVSSPS